MGTPTISVRRLLDQSMGLHGGGVRSPERARLSHRPMPCTGPEAAHDITGARTAAVLLKYASLWATLENV
jgi:hypothetical protein